MSTPVFMPVVPKPATFSRRQLYTALLVVLLAVTPYNNVAGPNEGSAGDGFPAAYLLLSKKSGSGMDSRGG
jgi:hypothetical protein